MNGMMKSCGNRWRGRAVLAALLGAAVLIGGSAQTARAADDEEFELPDSKFFRQFMHALGLRNEQDYIEYRERPPLVVPPGSALPAPETGDAAAKAAGWPVDPDVQRAKKRKAERKFANPNPEDARPLTPSEYSLPGGASPRSKPDGSPDSTFETESRPSSPAELGAKNVFSSIFSKSKEEYTTFTAEPPRQRLIDPPAGYRTPSPNQPYGLGQATWKPTGPRDAHEVVK
jgi:hypothetical protein